MKKNKLVDNRAFVLAETIVVAIFVTGISVFLIANILPLIGDYERIQKYDSLEYVYKTHEIRKLLLRNDSLSRYNLNTKYAFNRTDPNLSFDLNGFCLNISPVDYCETLLNMLEVEGIIVTKEPLSGTTNLKAQNFERGYNEYIKYLPTYSTSTGYRIIVGYSDGNFASVEV